MSELHRYVLPRAPGSDAGAIGAQLWATGAMGVWEQPDALVAWFEEPRDDVPPGGRWEIEPDRDWQAEWKAGIRPVHAGRVVVVPTWLADDHEPTPDEVTLVLDPGRAFGSGHHATTTLCLELLQELDLGGCRVLDLGCGTGVLALAAARLGARCVVAVDVDRDAVEVTRENAARLDVALDVRHGSIDSGGAAPADVVLANLVTDTIVALADRLVAAVAPGGWLIASGISTDRAPTALEALRVRGVGIEVVRERDGWIALLGRAPTSPSGG